MPMNPIIKAKWIAALRSGDYTQGKQVLHNRHDNTYCCLGVLCDLALQEGVVEARDATASGLFCTEYGKNLNPFSDADSTILPRSVSEWAGLDPAYPVPLVTARGMHRVKLSHLNDTEEASFSEIADLIESQL